MSSPSSPVPNVPGPVPGPSAHVAALPATVVARLSAMFTRMQAAGVLEPMLVYGRAPVYQGNAPVARASALLTTLNVHVAVGGGAIQLAPEAVRGQVTEIAFFQPDPSGSLTEETWNQLTIVLPQRTGAMRYPVYFQTFGPYCFIAIRSGGTTAPAGA